VTLRRRRDGEFAYLDSGRGFVVLRSNDRALFYSETAGEFGIRITESLSCAQSADWRCRTREEFLALLPPEREPGSVEGMLELLEWATRNSDYAGSAGIDEKFSAGSLDPHQIYFKYLANNSAAGYCGAQATFLTRLLRERGYQAFSFNFGVLADDLTHVATIGAHEDKFFVVDATFGIYLADANSDVPLDLFDALDGAPYRYKSFSAPKRDFLYLKNDPAFRKALKLREAVRCERVSGDLRRCDRPTFSAQSYFTTWSDALIRNGLPANEDAYLELVRRGFFNVGRPDSPATKRFVAELLKRGIPFVPTTPGSATATLMEGFEIPVESVD